MMGFMSENNLEKIEFNGQLIAVESIYRTAEDTDFLQTANIAALYNEKTGMIDSQELIIAAAMAGEDSFSLFDQNQDGKVSFREVFENGGSDLLDLTADSIAQSIPNPADFMSDDASAHEWTELATIGSAARAFITERQIDLGWAAVEEASLSFPALTCHIIEAVKRLDGLDDPKGRADGVVHAKEFVHDARMFGLTSALHNLNMEFNDKWGSSLSEQIHEIRNSCGDLRGGLPRVEGAFFEDAPDAGLPHQANISNTSESNKGRG